jgi:hypothetical protein
MPRHYLPTSAFLLSTGAVANPAAVERKRENYNEKNVV